MSEPLLSFKYRTREWLAKLGGRLPDAKQLTSWSQAEGVHGASRLLYESILNSELQRSFLDLVATGDRVSEENAHHTDLSSDAPFEVLIVSSTGTSSWGSHVETYRGCADSLDLPVDEIVTYKDNNIGENARLIGDAIQASSTKKIVVTVSQGSLEMAYLIRQNDKNPNFNLSSIAAWINVGGSIAGSELAGGILASPWRSRIAKMKSWFRKKYYENLVQAAKSNPLWRSSLMSIEHALRVTVLPLCFESHLPSGMAGDYQKLGELGPNDGLNLASDMMFHPGLVYPVWGKPVALDPNIVEFEFMQVLLAVRKILSQKHRVEYFLSEEEDASSSASDYQPSI